MKHPTSQLAGYVDDSLEPSERKRVEAHLGSCRACADEVEVAATGREALRSLVQEDVPVGVTSPVIQEAASRGAEPDGPAAARSSASPLRSRYAGIYKVTAAAAAIAIVGALATSLFRSDTAQMSAGGSEQAPTDFMKVQDADPGRFDRDGNYTAAELTAYAERAAGAFGPAPEALAGSSSDETQVAEAPASERLGGAPELGQQNSLPPGTQPIGDEKAFKGCLDTIGAYDHGGRLISSFEGLYLDKPAYFATLTEGPDANEPQDRLVVWVLGKNCWVLAFTQQRFPTANPSPLPTDYMHPVP